LPRNIPTVLTMADLGAICNHPPVSSYNVSGVISPLRPRFTSKLQGKAVCFSLDDGSKRWYKFERDALSFSTDGENFQQEYAESLESTVSGVFLIHHLHTDVVPCAASTLMLDTETALVTLVSDTLGTVYSNRDVNRKVLFGTLEGASGKEPHALTDDLTGRVIDWKYAQNVIVHQMYENRSCCAFVSPPPAAAPDWRVYFATFNPTKYVKIRKNLYLVSFYAPGSSGMEVTMLMDLDAMAQIGAAFGVDMTDTLRSYTFGGVGAWAEAAFRGRFTVE
jgi:hypothetical protein